MSDPTHGHPTLGQGAGRALALLHVALLAATAGVAVIQLTAHTFSYDPSLGAPLVSMPAELRAWLRSAWPGLAALPLAALVVPRLRRFASLAALLAVVGIALVHGPLYSPVRYLEWLAALRGDRVLGPIVLRPLAGIGLVLALALLVALTLRRLPRAGHVHGSNRFATPREIERFGLFARSGIVLGRLASGRRSRTLRHAGTEHVLFIGHTRSGKTSGCAIPTVLGWRDHLVVFDPKGAEIFTATAGAKRRGGHRVIRFAPTEPAGARWNPLLEIEPGPRDVGQVQRLAHNLIVHPAGFGGDPHWIQSARQVFVCLALHVLYGEEQKTIGRCRDLLMGTPGSDPWAAFKTIVETAHDPELRWGWRDPITGAPSATHPEVERIASALLKTPDRELGSILSTLNKFLEPWADPFVDRATSGSDFTLRALRSRGTPAAVYVTVPRGDVERLAPLLRVFFTSAGAVLSAAEHHIDWAARRDPGRRTLVVLDEFASLGHMPFFAQMLSVLAGYGVTLLILVQDYAQLTSTYGRDEPISGGCPFLVATSSSRPETMAYLSRLTGETTVEWTKVTLSGTRGFGLGRSSTSTAEARRPLLTEGEIRTLPADAQLVFAPGLQPILAKKAPYFADRRLLGLSRLPAPRESEVMPDPFDPWRFVGSARRVGKKAAKKFFEGAGKKASPSNLKGVTFSGMEPGMRKEAEGR